MIAEDRDRRRVVLRRWVSSAGVLAVALGAPACGVGSATDVAAPCEAMADVPWYADADALGAAATTMVVGAVTDVERTEEPVEGEDAGGLATVYSVDVSASLRGDAVTGGTIEVWETCTVETSRTQLAVDDGAAVLFFANEHGALVGQSQGRLSERADGTFRADVQNVETPVVTAVDLAGSAGS